MQQLHQLSFRFRNPPGKAFCFDLLVNGKPFADFFPEYEDSVMPFAVGYKDLRDELGPIDEFLGKRPTVSKFGVPFLICSQCHDEGCGGVWGNIEVTDQNVRWKNFSEGDEDLQFIFHKAEYFATFASLRREIISKHEQVSNS